MIRFFSDTGIFHACEREEGKEDGGSVRLQELFYFTTIFKIILFKWVMALMPIFNNNSFKWEFITSKYSTCDYSSDIAYTLS